VFEMVDVQTVSIIIASASVVAGVIYYAFQIRHQTKVRETDLLVRLYSSMFTNKEFMRDLWRVWDLKYKDYGDYVKRYGSLTEIHEKNSDLEDSMNVVLNQGELLGHLLKRKVVNADLLYEFYNVTKLWKKLRPLIEGWRKEQNTPTLCVWFEYLYNEMKKREQKLQQSKG
jgi:hypothetical protein